MVGKAKWYELIDFRDAWNEVKGLPAEEAKRRYLAEIGDLAGAVPASPFSQRIRKLINISEMSSLDEEEVQEWKTPTKGPLLRDSLDDTIEPSFSDVPAVQNTPNFRPQGQLFAPTPQLSPAQPLLPEVTPAPAQAPAPVPVPVPALATEKGVPETPLPAPILKRGDQPAMKRQASIVTFTEHAENTDIEDLHVYNPARSTSDEVPSETEDSDEIFWDSFDGRRTDGTLEEITTFLTKFQQSLNAIQVQTKNTTARIQNLERDIVSLKERREQRVRVASLSWKALLVILSWPVVVLMLRSLIRRRGLKAK